MQVLIRSANEVGTRCAELILRFHQQGIEPSRWIAESILSHLLGCTRLALKLNHQLVFPKHLEDKFEAYALRIEAGEPLPYLLGQTVFMGYALKTDARALIPRPETEVLVEHVLKDSYVWSSPHPCIVDLGTGSGCILVALASKHPDGRYVGLDRSKDALSLAQENLRAHALTDRVALQHAVGLSELSKDSVELIVSNPPYLRSSAIPSLDRSVREYEPLLALDGGEDGLDVIRVNIPLAYSALKKGGRIYLEMDEDHGPQLTEMLLKQGFTRIQIFNDLADLPRVISAEAL